MGGTNAGQGGGTARTDSEDAAGALTGAPRRGRRERLKLGRDFHQRDRDGKRETPEDE